MCALLRAIYSVGSNPTRQLLFQPEVLWSNSGGDLWVKAFKEKASKEVNDCVGLARSEH